jgi:hypothetical protein
MVENYASLRNTDPERGYLSGIENFKLHEPLIKIDFTFEEALLRLVLPRRC